jgi:putative endonuclease
MKWVVYILECADKSLYTGITNDLPKRLEAHRKGVASRYTRSRLPIKPVYDEKLGSRSEALKRESMIKQMSRADKLDLVDDQKRE